MPAIRGNSSKNNQHFRRLHQWLAVFFYLCCIYLVSMLIIMYSLQWSLTRLLMWTILETLPRGGEGCLAVRTGSSIVMETPVFCWLIERRMRVSPGLTRGTKGGGGQTVNMASPLLDIIYDISYILLYYISYNVKTHQFSTFFFFYHPKIKSRFLYHWRKLHLNTTCTVCILCIAY